MPTHVVKSGSYAAPGDLGSGTPSGTTFLRGDQTWATPGGSGASLTAATVILTNALLSHVTTVVDAGVSATSKIMCSLAPAPETDENSGDMLDVLNLTTSAGTGSFLVYITALTPIRGPIKLNYLVS